MKRSELYALVWSAPVSQISKTLNLSDVGLAKMCRRQTIPVPPRGYWAKRKGGYKGNVPPLSKPEQDPEILFPQTTKRAGQKEQGLAPADEERLLHSATQIESRFEMPTNLDKAHKLIAITASYCKRLPSIITRYERTKSINRSTPNFEFPPHEDYGRLDYHRAEGLEVKAALDTVDWVLRFHHGVFSALTTRGVVFRRERSKQNEPVRVIADLDGEQLCISFAQGYSRQLPAIKPRSADWRSAITGQSSPSYTAVDRMNFKVEGSEYQARKTWTGTQKQLESQLTEIVNGCLTLFEIQPIARREREEETRRRELEAHREQEVRRKRATQKEQVQVALEAAKALESDRLLSDFLDLVKERADGLDEPERTRALAWLATVREHRRADPIADLLHRVAKGNDWQFGQPAWWPGDPPRFEAASTKDLLRQTLMPNDD